MNLATVSKPILWDTNPLKKKLQGLIWRRLKREMVSNELDGLQHISLENNIVSILTMSTKTRNVDILLLDVSSCMYVVYMYVFFGTELLIIWLR